jgi:3-phenylpropionate/trans-cinnamate dioxygenase ferredoxin subunit
MGLRIGVSRSSTVGVFEHSRAGEMVRCPWHGWEFDIRTGQSYCDPSKVRVRTFEVAVMDGAALAEGPYVAETFPVSVENEYIVIDV